MLLHVLVGTIAAGPLPITFGLPRTAAVTTSTQCDTAVVLVLKIVFSGHGRILKEYE